MHAVTITDDTVVELRSADTCDQLICGDCGALLLEIDAGIQVRDLVIHCPRCGSFNDPTPMDA
jgi:phage FluMu protein Com